MRIENVEYITTLIKRPKRTHVEIQYRRALAGRMELEPIDGHCIKY